MLGQDSQDRGCSGTGVIFRFRGGPVKHERVELIFLKYSINYLIEPPIQYAQLS